MHASGRYLRLPVAALVSAGVTCALFLCMHYLILTGGGQASEREAIARIRFGKVEIAADLAQRSRRQPPPPPPASDPLPWPKLQPSRLAQPARDMPAPDLPDLDVPLVVGEGFFPGVYQPTQQPAEGDVAPVVVIRPFYPREAAAAGIEGWVRVEFTITETGAVRDPQVVEAQPPRIFNREAIRALLKWRFKPRVVDGIAVERRATQVIDFNLDEPVP